MHLGMLQDRVVGPEIVLAPMAQDEALSLDPRCFADQAVLLFAERQPAEALVEARDLAASVEQLGVTARPSRMHLGINVEVQRVAFLAPGGAGLETRAVGHLDGDRVVIGVSAGLYRDFLGLATGFRPAVTARP